MQLNGQVSGAEVAKSAGLYYMHDDEPGLRRLGKTRADFHYVDVDGAPVRDEATLTRIQGLAIPPAWTEVWISPNPRGHIQATGQDARGRKQYRYHPHWREARDAEKFAHMAAFGRALPTLRRKLDEDLRKHSLSHDKVTAAVIALLERTLIRVGNEEYARDNKSFGLTTMRMRHATLSGSAVTFEFTGKSGVKHRTQINDRRLARIVKACSDLPGQRLFQYLDEDGHRRRVGSADVNAYLLAATGEHFTAKDFRTWAGTLAAAKALAQQGPPSSEAEARQSANACIKAASGLLGNTPAVCRKAYIHPGVLTAFHNNALPRRFAKVEGEAFEKAAIRFLDTFAQGRGEPRAA